MIEAFKIANFKSHKETNLSLGNLTLLTGVNGVGKSTVIQSLLLLRQTYRKRGFRLGLDLNKPLCDIGTAHEAWYRAANGNPIVFELSVDGKSLKWVFDPKETLDKTFIPLHEECINGAVLNELSLFNNDFQYISALRVAGKSSYGKDDIAVMSERQISIDYGQGELVAHFLFQYGNQPIHEDIAKVLGVEAEDDSRYLIAQVQLWEQAISPGVTVRAEKTIEDNITIKYGFEAEGANKPLQNLRSENVGFGISYALPVIVALLSAKPGALILIENPEAHLHPEGQAMMAQLIALVAQAGVQVVIETHSDHIINGVFVACKRYEQQRRGLDKKKVCLYYMGQKDERHATVTQKIEINNAGQIEYQPKGFFDRIEIDLTYLMGL